MRSFRQVIQPMPQPYKRWVARLGIVITLIPCAIFYGAIDAVKWTVGLVEEVRCGWEEVSRW